MFSILTLFCTKNWKNGFVFSERGLFDVVGLIGVFDDMYDPEKFDRRLLGRMEGWSSWVSEL